MLHLKVTALLVLLMFLMLFGANYLLGHPT